MRRFIKHILSLALVTWGLSSCHDFLDVNNYSGIPSDDFVSSVDNAQTVVNGAYSGLYGLQLWRAEIYYYMDFATGELECRHTDGNLIQLTNFGYTPDQAWVKDYWRSLYRLIARANDACTKIWALKNNPSLNQTLTEADIVQLNQMIGECNFLRALGYYYLVRSFGERLPSDADYNPAGMGVPIVDSLLTEKDQLMIGRSTLKETWDKVISDFTTAYNLLPTKWDNGKFGAATKGAAAGYLGQLYMYFGMQDANALNTAKDWFDKCISAGGYQLVKNYSQNFDYEHENNSESIFEVQAEIANDDEISNYMWRRLGPEPIWWGTCNVSKTYVNKFLGGYEVSQSLYDDVINHPANYMTQTNPQYALVSIMKHIYKELIGKTAKSEEDFVNLFQGDWNSVADNVSADVLAVAPRSRFNLLTDDPKWGTVNSKYLSVIMRNAVKETDPRMYASFYVPNVDSLYLRWDRSDKPILYTTNYYGFKKYIPNNAIESWSGEGLPGFEGNSPINERILRLGEVYLLYAEILYRQGNLAEAKKYLNMVRRRAWGEDINSNTAQKHDYIEEEGNFLDVLVLEREKEMCLEGTLWFDYLRMGLAESRFASRGFSKTKTARLPIPLSERQIVGLDILKQNPEY